MKNEVKYDVAIVGGGLAGLALSIQLARLGHAIILFEKEQYPFHKVCGEYISLESWDFLNELGVDLDGMQVPIITKLEFSAENGKTLQHPLPLGGFGISRYTLDHTLVQLARAAGVTVQENTKVNELYFKEDEFIVETSSQQYRAALVCGTWGKRSNIDIKWKRPFSIAAKNKLNNYIGVKYHIRGPFATDTIGLYNFKEGYCGLVKIEGDCYNLCYLTTARNLQTSNGDIATMEQKILARNPQLQHIFATAKKMEAPLVISQISFSKKTQVENHMLMIGDAAGMITPLCGNGMSMALHGSKLAAVQVHHFLEGKINREKMEKRYILQWKNKFGDRLKTGRRIQRLFGSNRLTNLFIQVLKPFPGLLGTLIRKTHGKPF